MNRPARVESTYAETLPRPCAEQVDHVKVFAHRVDEPLTADDAHATRLHDALDHRAESTNVLDRASMT